MQRFLSKVLFFCIPVMAALAPAFFVLFFSGENYRSIDPVLEKEEPYLIGYAYNENNYRYLKWQTLATRERQSLVALGSSRVLQFRRQMFDSSFYNAGYTISSISDFIPFLKSLPEDKYPNALLIGLDQWMFNENWDALKDPPAKPSHWSESFQFLASSQTYTSVYKDLWKQKYGVSTCMTRNDSLHRVLVGLNAMVNGTGFRNDGSMFYGKQIKKLLLHDPTAEDDGYADTYKRIEKGNSRFEYGTRVHTKALKELEQLLAFCNAHQLQVVAFFPPYAGSVNQKMKKKGQYRYMDSLYARTAPLFRKYHAELWDFTHPETCGSNDKETIDGFHGSEVMYGRMLLYMIDHQSVLNRYTSRLKLAEQLNRRANSYSLYRD